MKAHVAGAPRVSGIYRIWNLATGKTYVGSSANVRRRAQKHLSELERGTHGNSLLQRAWAKHGPAAFGFALLFPCPADQLIGYEQWFMDAFQVMDRRCGYNIVPFADRHELNPETVAKMSASLKGKNLGKVVPSDRRERIAASLRGRPMSPETLAKRKATLAARSPAEKAAVAAKVSAALTGRRKSKAACASMAAARTDVWASWTLERREEIGRRMSAGRKQKQAIAFASTLSGEPT